MTLLETILLSLSPLTLIGFVTWVETVYRIVFGRDVK